jgi:heme-degrading monooxygenase HmoA
VHRQLSYLAAYLHRVWTAHKHERCTAAAQKCHNWPPVFIFIDAIMILEIADIRIQPGRQAEFDAAITKGVTEVIAKAKGFNRFTIQKGMESPERYVLMIYWDTLENHTVDFRQSPAFLAWRDIVGPYFAAPPNVEHFTLLTESSR